MRDYHGKCPRLYWPWVSLGGTGHSWQVVGVERMRGFRKWGREKVGPDPMIRAPHQFRLWTHAYLAFGPGITIATTSSSAENPFCSTCISCLAMRPGMVSTYQALLTMGPDSVPSSQMNTVA